MDRSDDPLGLLMLGPVEPISWGRFKREVAAAWPGPPVCSRGHAKALAKALGDVEALDLADEGEPPRAIAGTGELTVSLVTRFARSLPAGLSPHYVKFRLARLRILCNYAEENRWVGVSPFRLRRLSRFVRVPAVIPGKRHLSRDEVRRIFEVLRRDVEVKRGWALWRARRLYALVSTVAYTGLRAGEAQCLWAEDVDPAGRVINLVPRPTRLPDAGGIAGDGPRLKTEQSAQPIAIPAALVPILEDWGRHRLDRPEGLELPRDVPWLFPGSLRASAWTGGAPGLRPVDRLKAAGARAGVEGATFKVLRRTWATAAEAQGIPQALITRQCRHSDQRTTREWYQRRDLDALRAAVEGFDF
jgi:integrase